MRKKPPLRSTTSEGEDRRSVALVHRPTDGCNVKKIPSCPKNHGLPLNLHGQNGP